jgi:DNA polymerase-1
MKKLFLVDAYALIYRFYYAFINRPMRNAEGLNTSPIFGFVKFLRDILAREQPDYLGVAFDSKGPTFRHEMFPEYKANRAAAPEDIHASVPYIKEILACMRIPVLEMCGYEADDIIGTLAKRGAAEGMEVYMVTPDKDFGQLVERHISIYKHLRGGEGVEIVGEEQIKNHYNIDDTRKVADILALWGDASDNIPGVTGIGEKGAIKLVSTLGTVEQILANTDKLSGKQRDNIIASRDQLLMSKKLATIDTAVPMDFRPEELIVERPDTHLLKEQFRKLGFNMFIREMEQKFPEEHTAAVATDTQGATAQPDLFSATAPAQPKPTAKTTPAPQMQGTLFGEQGTLFDESGEAEEFEIAATVPHTYHTVRSAEELRELVGLLHTHGSFCFDTETTGFDVFTNRLVGMSFAIKPHEAWYVPFSADIEAEYAKIIRPLFEDADIEKTGQNIKFDMMVLRAMLGVEVRGFLYDTMIMHYLLNPESRHGMNYLSRTYLNYDPIEIEALIGRGAKQITMDMVPVDKVAEYAAEDADVTQRLKEALWPQVVEQGLADLYKEIEEPIIGVLADMEMAGVKIDAEGLHRYGAELSGQMQELERQIRALAGDPTLNVNSARQLGDTLFGRMRIDPKPKKTKTKQYSTDEEYLQSLAGRHPIINLILEYRGIKKLLSTYIDALPQLINPKTGRVHTSFNQAVTATGRLSSSNPNLQNIPIRDEQGREIRKAFVPADDDHLLLSADYSQVELRLMAHLSGDEALLDAFRRGEDVHADTASRLFGVPISEVTSEMRRKAKTANFGIIYGISAFGLSQRLGIPRTEAKEIIDGYFRSYPGVHKYMESVVAHARETGYVTTIFGRKRYLPDIRSANPTTRGLAERNAINAPIQGSAADIMKLAMIRAHNGLAAAGLQSKIILQVHDELVVDMLKTERAEVERIITEAMEHAATLSIALTVECGVGENWLEAH